MLKNKIIVVTGASGSLGSRIIQQFAEEGAAIAAVVRTDEEAQRIPFPEDGDGWAFPADLTNEDLVRACFDSIRRQFNRIDALVHTVGAWEMRPFGETSLDQWKAVMQTNLLTTFLCFREAARVMDGPGRLIAFASRQGADRGPAEQAAYAASKAGVIRLVESVNDEYRGRGITAHAIAPSNIVFEGDGAGVRAGDIVDLCRSLIARAGDALSGATIRAYGSA